jgi:hypothetical protein
VDEIQRLILKVEGQAELARLNAELAKEQEHLQKLVQIKKDGVVAVDPATVRQSAQAILDLNGQIDKLAGQGGMGGGGILQASYAVQDFTSVLSGGQGLDRALSSVQNNIPGLLMSLGMSGGLAGVVSLVSVGIGALIPVVEKLWASLGDGEGAEKAREKLEELRKEFEALSKAATRAEAQGSKSIREVITEGGADEIAGAAAKTLSMTGGGEDMTEEERLAVNSVKNARPDVKAGVEKRVFDRINKANAERAQQIVAGATQPGEQGASARAQLRGLVGANAGAFPSGLLGDLERAEPSEIAAQQALERQGELNAANMERAAKARREEEARGEAQRALDIQGRKNAQAFDKRTEAKGKAADEFEERQDRGLAAQARREAPMRGARRAVARTAADMGFTGDSAPNPGEIDEMAKNALANFNNGMNGQQAAWMAVMQRVQAIQQMSQQFQQMQSSQQMGGDFSGQFSRLTPYY